VSFLTPWYILGLSAVLAPVVLHLIRRVPRGEVPFGSIMFLSPTPPRLTRRSRLDQWLLLVLRAAAFCLLAFAFARPFWRQETRLGSSSEQGRRIAVLIDTSASMRRGNVWPRAKALAREVIASCRPVDELAVFSFDDSFRQVLGFARSSALAEGERQAVALSAVEQLAPSWGATHLGEALIESVSVIASLADADAKRGRMPRRIVLVSDLQHGSRYGELGDFEWPSDIELELKTVSQAGSNAGVQALDDLPAVESSPRDLQGKERRVRVTNDAESQRETFELVWTDEKKPAAAKPTEVYVPAGESRVARLPRPATSSLRRTLRLKGDSFDFDNTLYLADSRRDEKTVYYIGKDQPADPAGLLYYLERVFLDTSEQTVHVIAAPPGSELAWDSDRSVPLVIVVAETTPTSARRLREYVRGGGTVLWVSTAPGRAEALATVAGVPAFDVDDAAGPTDVMLREIAFDHPLFSPFAAAQFNDFTKIHFWRHRRLGEPSLGESRVLARFEDGDIALLEKNVGKGKLFVLTSGWQPADSQLARSSKFLPLMTALLEGNNPRLKVGTNYFVHDPVRLPPIGGALQELTIRKPDGLVIRTTADQTFSQTDQPGVYTIDSPDGAYSFAVNLDPSESKTSPLHVETLEQFGCRLVKASQQNLGNGEGRQMQGAELENRQQLWRWLTLAAILVLILETWLAGRLSRPRLARAEALAT
jgi:Aerotolerance regulator N-terminal/von Willebrand factor type A domain